MLADKIIKRIEFLKPKMAKKIRESLYRVDIRTMEEYLIPYEEYMLSIGESLDYGVDCYLKLCDSMLYERIRFMQTGHYSSNSVGEVNERVYDNSIVMREHMFGLALAQFLWKEQYSRFCFFEENLIKYRDSIDRYLEIGGGHALHLNRAIDTLYCGTKFDLVDISLESIKLSEGIVRYPKLQSHLMDIHDFFPMKGYDWINIGEVLEHVEDPVKLLKKVRSLMAPDGDVFISVPANAPTIDHIFLFNDASEIRDMITSVGFDIADEILEYSEDLPANELEENKIALMYAAILR